MDATMGHIQALQAAELQAVRILIIER
jgi:hypothetical protein